METKAFNDKRTLYVGGLETTVTKAAVYSLFIPFGDVQDVIVPTEEKSTTHRGFAFVEFELAEDAAHALENMNDAEFYGKVLKINFAKPDAMQTNRAIWERNDYHLKDLPDAIAAGDETGTETEEVAMVEEAPQTSVGPQPEAELI